MSSARASEEVHPPQERLTPAFLLLAVFLMLQFLRPAELIYAPLASLRLPLLVSLLCLASHTVASLMQGRLPLALNPVAKTMAVMTLWILCTIPFAHWQYGSLMTFEDGWVKMMLLSLLLGNVLQGIQRLRQIVWVVMLCVVLVSSLSLLSYLTGGDNSAAGRMLAGVSGPYSGANYLSMTVLMVFPYAVFFFFFSNGKWVRLVALGCAGVLSIANFFTQSRAGLVGFAVIILLSLWKFRRLGKSLVKPVAAMALGCALLLAAAPQGLWLRVSGLFSTVAREELPGNSPLRMAIGSQEERKALMAKAITLTFENPIFGVGLGNFGSASAGRFTTGSGRDWVRSHNTYLQFSSELGVVGLILYMMLLYFAFRELRRAKSLMLRAPPGSARLQGLVLCEATSVSLVGYVILSFFAHVGLEVYFYLLAGLAQALPQIAQRMVLAAPREVAPTKAPALAIPSPASARFG